jgi:hypothetical protein
MDSILGILVILAGLGSAGFGVYRLMHMSDTIRALKHESEGAVTKAKAEVLQLEGFLETLGQKLDERTKTLNELSDKLKATLDTLSPEIRETRPAIYVAMDRRAKGDVEFRATVTNTRLSGDWALGRTYAIWGKDEEIARRSLETKFPPSGNYTIDNLTRPRDPL